MLSTYGVRGSRREKERFKLMFDADRQNVRDRFTSGEKRLRLQVKEMWARQ